MSNPTTCGNCGGEGWAKAIDLHGEPFREVCGECYGDGVIELPNTPFQQRLIAAAEIMVADFMNWFSVSREQAEEKVIRVLADGDKKISI